MQQNDELHDVRVAEHVTMHSDFFEIETTNVQFNRGQNSFFRSCVRLMRVTCLNKYVL